jgi:hypothetical protein
MSGFCAQPVSQSFSVDRDTEDLVLEKLSINQAIDESTPVLYKRMIMNLHALVGWDANLIAECTGLPEKSVSQTINHLGPRVIKAMNKTSMAPIPG